MAISANTPRNQYTATSGQTVFAYSFELFDKDDAVVYQGSTLLAEGTDYTVSGVGVDTGGNITLTTGATTGDIITIYRDTTLQRLTDYQASGDFLAADVNDDFDRLWSIIQEKDGNESLAIRKPVTDPDSLNMELAAIATRANTALGFNASGGLDYLSGTMPTGTQRSYSTVAAMVADTAIVLGDWISVEDYATGNNSGALFFKAVAAATGTADGGSYIDLTGSGLQAKQNFPGYYHVDFWGAGGGVSVDLTSAQAAVDYARSQSVYASVKFGPKEYLFDGTLVADRVSLFADPGQAVIKSSGVLSSNFLIECAASVSYGNARPTIENLYIDCNSECNGIDVQVRHHNIINCYVVNANATATNKGISLQRNTQLVKNCHIMDCGYGVYLDGVTGATIAASSVVENHISDCETAGIYSNEAFKLTIEDNVIQTCGTEIILQSAVGTDFDGCSIRNNYTEDQGAVKTEFILIDATNANDVESITISENSFYGGNVTGAVAIRVVNAEVVNVLGNFFRAVPYTMAFTNNSAGTSGVYEGNALSTNVTSAFDATDATTLAAMRKFRFGKNKGFNAKVSGTDTIATTVATETVTHGLDIAPEKVILSYYDTTDAVVNSSGVLYASNIGATTFDANRDTAAANNAKFAYVAWFGEL